MKRFAYTVLLVIVLHPWSEISLAQNTFEFLLDYPVRKWSADCIEDEYGNYIAIISEGSGFEYSPSNPSIAYLLTFGPNGDTTIRNFHFFDSTFNFNNIFPSKYGGYLVTGFSSIESWEEFQLFLLEINEQLDTVWTQRYDFSDFCGVGFTSIFQLQNGYILAGSMCYYPCASIYPYFMRIDNKGNVLHSAMYPDNTPADEFEYLLNPDSSQIWCFSGGGLDPINGPSVAVFDTSFNHIFSVPLPESSMGHFTVNWHTDTSFLLGYIGQRPGATYEDDEMYVGLYDTLLNTYHLNYFGAQDTNDYTARRRNIDFRHPDSIYFAGWKNQDFGYPTPNAVSWIMTGQLDSELQPRYLHFIGGDAYYETHYIMATKDGGSFICAGVWDPDEVVYHLLFLKLNNEGLLVGNKPPGIIIKKALLYPNPACDYLYLQTGLRDAQLLIYRVDGIEVLRHAITGTKDLIDVMQLTPGPYIYTITTPDGYKENGKFIKQ